MLSVPVQLIAWEDRPRNDVLYVERDIKQLLTHSLVDMFQNLNQNPRTLLPKFYGLYCYQVTATQTGVPS